LQLPAYLDHLSCELRTAAVDLRPRGVAEVGFHLPAALDAIRELEAHDVAVLGGDTWTIRGVGDPEIFPSLGWHAEWGVGEEWQDYVSRAAAYGRDRITSADAYTRDENWGTAIFALVACGQRRYEELTALEQARAAARTDQPMRP
jgi:hypothetical protein